MKLKELFSKIYVLDFKNDWDKEVSGMAYSSKEIKPGYLFAALKGENVDGNNYVIEAINKGAIAVLSEKKPFPNIPVSWIQVHDARKTLALISAKFYNYPSKTLNLIGVTGTNGKTTTTYILEKIFESSAYSPGIIGSIEYRYKDKKITSKLTTPESLDIQRILREMVDSGITHCIMEVSSHSLELDRVIGLNFKVGVFTNLTGDHLDFHNNMENYYHAKRKLFFPEKNEMKAVINVDDEWGKRLIKEIPIGFITYGIKEKADIKAKKYYFSERGIEALIETPKGKLEIYSSLLGKPNLYNILASIGVGLLFNLPEKKIIEGISNLDKVPGRMERVNNNLGFNVLIDYAHSDDSLKNLLETVNCVKKGKIILVFGAGGDRDKSKRPRMGEVAGRLSDFSIITSDNPRSEDPFKIISEIEKGFKKINKKNYTIIPDREEAIRKAVDLAEENDWVLIAGKGHENYQILKDKIIPFNDREVAEKALRERDG